MNLNDEKQCMLDSAKRLYGLRREKGQSARDLSLSLGFAPNYISNLESVKNYPTIYICEYAYPYNSLLQPIEKQDKKQYNKGKRSEKEGL